MTWEYNRKNLRIVPVLIGDELAHRPVREILRSSLRLKSKSSFGARGKRCLLGQLLAVERDWGFWIATLIHRLQRPGADSARATFVRITRV